MARWGTSNLCWSQNLHGLRCQGRKGLLPQMAFTKGPLALFVCRSTQQPLLVLGEILLGLITVLSTSPSAQYCFLHTFSQALISILYPNAVSASTSRKASLQHLSIHLSSPLLYAIPVQHEN